MGTNSIGDCSWFPFSDEPLLTGSRLAPKICDPQVILPSRSCDGKWHMFTHDWTGIQHYVSDSGIAWEAKQIIQPLGLYPYIYYEDETFYLLYEKHDDYFFSLRKKTKEEHYSRIEIISSSDLITWSKPRILLDSRNVPFAGDYINRNKISRPQLIKDDDIYHLYFGASEVVLEDSKQKVSRYLGCAFSRKLDDPFILEKPEQPILESDPNDPYSNLACGSVKIVLNNGKYYGFQCGAFWDEERKKSSSALRLLESKDGILFKPVDKKALLVPAQKGWTSSYIMSCDVRYKDDEKCWYCYYSANSKESYLPRKESIGLLIGAVPSKVQMDLSQQSHEVVYV